MGYGFPAAMGAQVAYPDKLVIDNNNINWPVDLAIYTDLDARQAVTSEFRRVTLRNAGVLAIGEGDALIVTNTTVGPLYAGPLRSALAGHFGRRGVAALGVFEDKRLREADFARQR